MVIAFDFDGTLVKDEFPNVGEPLEDGLNLMKRLIEEDVEVVLFTVRSGNYLQDAIEFLRSRGIEDFFVNQNANTISDSPKVYYDVIFDDRAFGAPLVREPGKKPYLDWGKILTTLKTGTFY